jgi:hypothetical protein
MSTGAFSFPSISRSVSCSIADTVSPAFLVDEQVGSLVSASTTSYAFLFFLSFKLCSASFADQTISQPSLDAKSSRWHRFSSFKRKLPLVPSHAILSPSSSPSQPNSSSRTITNLFFLSLLLHSPARSSTSTTPRSSPPTPDRTQTHTPTSSKPACSGDE